MIETTFPAVWKLAGGYFHQDWDLDDADEWAVIDNFVRNEPEVGLLLPGELLRVLERCPTDEEARALWLEAEAMTLGPPDGEFFRDWLAALAQRARASVWLRSDPDVDHRAVRTKDHGRPTEFGSLEYVLLTYFYPDWNDDYADEWDVLDEFVEADREVALDLADEVTVALARCTTDAAVRDLLIALGSMMTGPAGEKRAWLGRVGAHVTRALAAGDPTPSDTQRSGLPT